MCSDVRGIMLDFPLKANHVTLRAIDQQLHTHGAYLGGDKSPTIHRVQV